MESIEGKKEALPDISFARATENDLEAFLELERSVDGSHTYSAMTDEDEARAELKKGSVYFIREGGKIVGSIMYETPDSGHVHISGLVVHPDYQGRGIGRAAMLKLMETMKDVPTIDLVTHPENENAIKLYESLGFTRGQVIENYYGDGQPRVMMTFARTEK